MKRFRRLMAWSFFLGVPIAAGLLAHRYVRSTPRFTIAGWHSVEHVSADGRWLVTTTADDGEQDHVSRGRLRVWDIRSCRLARSFEVDLPIEQSPDHRYFACRRAGGTRLIDWQSGQSWTICEQEDPPHQMCGFHPTGKWLCILAGPSSFLLIDPATKHVAHRLHARLWGFIKDRYALVSSKHLIEVVDLDGGLRSMSLKTDLELLDSVAVSPDARWLVLGRAYASEPGVTQAADGAGMTFYEAEVWDLTQPRRLFQFLDPERHVSWHVMFSGRNRRVATWKTTPERHHLSVHDLEEDRELLNVMVPQASLSLKVGKQPQFVEAITAQFSPDASMFLFGQRSDTTCILRVFDVVSGRLLWEKYNIVSATFTKEGGYVLCQNAGKNTLTILNVKTGEKHAEIDPYFESATLSERNIRSELIVVNGSHHVGRPPHFMERWLAWLWPGRLSESGGCLLVVDPRTGTERFRLHRNVNEFTLSEDGSTLVTWPLYWRRDPQNETVDVWDVRPHRARFWACAVSVLMGGFLLVLRQRRCNRNADRGVAVPTAGKPASDPPPQQNVPVA